MNIYEQMEKMDNSKIRVAAARMAELLAAEAKQLDRWAFEAERGGWSTQQVDPMKKRASDIRQSLLAVGIEV